MISSPPARSRLPVGSSASMSTGSLISARAIATRCCWPPESWCGTVVQAVAHPDLPQELLRLRPQLGRDAERDVRQEHVAERREIADQVEGLVDEPDPLAPVGVLLGLGHRGDVPAVDPDRARGRAVEGTEQVQQRALARARRADDERARLAGDPERHPAQGLDGLLAGVERSCGRRWLRSWDLLRIASMAGSSVQFDPAAANGVHRRHRRGLPGRVEAGEDRDRHRGGQAGRDEPRASARARSRSATDSRRARAATATAAATAPESRPRSALSAMTSVEDVAPRPAVGPHDAELDEPFRRCSSASCWRCPPRRPAAPGRPPRAGTGRACP